jgi:hypothetical protein
MKLAKLSVLSTAALLAGGISLAMAQSNPAPSASPGAASTSQGKCWDSASNQIKDKSAAAKPSGNATTGSSPSGQAANTQSKPGSMGAQDRPAAAAGLPNC